MKNLTVELKVAIKAMENVVQKISRDLLELKKIQGYYRGKMDFVEKLYLKIEKEIIAHIKFPRSQYNIISNDVKIIQEDKKCCEKYQWFVNPIDNIYNCMNAIPFISTSIALIEQKKNQRKTILGVILNPSNNEIFYAIDKIGAFIHDINGLKQRTRIRVNNNNNLENCLYVINKRNPHKEIMIQELEKHLSNKSSQFRSFGSLSLELAYLADGRIDIVTQVNGNVYENSAAILIVKEAQGTILDFSFKKLNINNNNSNIIAGNSDMINQLRQLVNV